MNIQKAKEQVKFALKAYFTKNQYGEYVIPLEKQRPIFLLGEPGIGKTAIMEQIAAELDVGLVSYSMTHHTRQSAIGLPFIATKTYGGEEYRVSEYTMSEIIASVYDMIERTGKKEGILFLDEINCVSETLAPAMLQFLQYKIFGKHHVPEGWLVVTAGNPPEFNDSVREFDIVTWDRLKKVVVEHDYDAWRSYAVDTGAHPAIVTYLDLKKKDFYSVETTADGKRFVTARGWSDLSEMIKLYERNDLPVDEDLVSQYLQNEKIAKNFAIYYELFRKYQADYHVEKIFEGQADNTVKKRAMDAKFDERISFIGLLLAGLRTKMNDVCAEERCLTRVLEALKTYKIRTAGYTGDALGKGMEDLIKEEEDKIETGKRASTLSEEDRFAAKGAVEFLKKGLQTIAVSRPRTGTDAVKALRTDYEKRVSAMKEQGKAVLKQLENTFDFLEEVYEGNGQEMLVFVTELIVSHNGARFLGRYDCPKYYEHSKALRLTERRNELAEEVASFDFDDVGED